MPLSIPQQTIANSTARFKVCVSGRRFGKTFLSVRELAYHARMPDQTVWYVAPSYRQAKRVVWEPLKHKLINLRWTKKINESDLSIKLVNGSTISLRGAENRDSLRGVGLNYLVMDEFAMINKKAWTEVLRPTLSDTLGKAMFITTPMGMGNWAYDMYMMHTKDPLNWESWQYTSLDGGNIPEEEIEAARNDLDERTFRQEYEATFETYSGKVSTFNRDINIKPVPEGISTKVIHIGMDFNVSPMTATIGVKTSETTMHIIDEIQMYGSNTDEMATEIRNRYPASKIFVYPDPSGTQRRSSANGKTDHKILGSAPYNFIVKSPRAHDPVRDRINALNSRLCNSNNIAHLFIAPHCKHIIECLEKLTYKEGTQIIDKDSGFDHFVDALSYKIAYLYPIKKDIIIQQPQRFGHAII